MTRLLYLAADCPLPAAEPELFPIDHGWDDVYSEKRHLLGLDWDEYSMAQAERLLAYIRSVLERTDELELWHIWMGEGEKPFIRTRTVTAAELAPAHIRELVERNMAEAYATEYDIPLQYRLLVRA